MIRHPVAFGASGQSRCGLRDALLGQQCLDLLLGLSLALHELFEGGSDFFKSHETRRGVHLTGPLVNSLTSLWRHRYQSRILILQKTVVPTDGAKLMMPNFGSKRNCDG